ncbi:hypothetical protein [Algoriphagus boritolerans]|uniref:Uncharacterized protein n=1 Tax=Algoriphagus boritolerans DSM 17298 = JCM 18970 TaxID=1120964 RepID=A0A1H5VA90_9BACT|nr:hypothetical protein [Algoriphagus boritolerans]SEF84239.1 hypothetical protein SAMN03080598_01617 [Algoriphagus boritolerans DSM 17298 = JCM 18970]
MLRENHRHSCEKEDLDFLFEGKSKELEFMFDKILPEVIEWDGVIVSNTKKGVMLVPRKTFGDQADEQVP